MENTTNVSPTSTSTPAPAPDPAPAPAPEPDLTVATDCPVLSTAPPDSIAVVPKLLPPLPPERPLTAEEITDGGSIGEVVVLPEAQQAELFDCEATIQKGCNGMIDMGVALATIRDHELYRAEYASFQVYCRERWGFEHSKIYQMIAVADVCKIIEADPNLPKPELEAQVRPLIGIPPHGVRMTWQYAFTFSRGGKITARTVRRALKETGYARKPPLTTEQREAKASRHQQIGQGFKDLLKMVGERAATGVIIEKIQSVANLVESLFAKHGKQGVQKLARKSK